MGRHRTDSEKVELRAQALALRAEGVKRADILKRLGIGDDLLNAFVSGAPLPDSLARPQAKDEVRAIAVGLREGGWTYDDIAAELGVSKGSCSLWLRDVAVLRQRAVAPSDAAPSMEPTSEADELGERHEAARELRRSGLLLAEIAEALDVSVQSAFRWTRGIAVPDRARHGGNAEHVKMMAEARWADYRITRDAAIARRLADAASEVTVVDDQTLLLLGAVAYWCEGSKSKPWSRLSNMTFINSDPQLIRLFLRWMDLVGAHQFKVRLQIHESADVDAALTYWSEVTGVPVRDFAKTSLKRHNPKTVRKNMGDAYRGCLSVWLPRSAELLDRVEGLVMGLMTRLSVDGDAPAGAQAPECR